MQVGQPSHTARSAAIYRAVHQVLEEGRIFKDPLAFRILGEESGPLDFERQTLANGLASAGFDRTEPSLFTWLGVVPYLSEDAIWSTLVSIASLPIGTQVVFDYGNPPELLPAQSRELHDAHAERVAELGEPWITFFETDVVRAKLQRVGFSEIEDLGPREISERYFPNRTTASPEHGGHVVRAAKR